MSSFKNRSPPSVFPGVFGLLTSKKFINFKCVLPESITVVYFTCQCRQCFETLRVHAICFHLWFVFLNFLVRVNFKAFINLIVREIAGPSSLGFCLFVCFIAVSMLILSRFLFHTRRKKKIFWRPCMNVSDGCGICTRFDKVKHLRIGHLPKVKHLRIANLPKVVITLPSHVI